MNTPVETPSQVPEPWQPRFSIGTMLLCMLVVSGVAAGASYFAQSLRHGRAWQLVFIIFTAAAPLLLGVMVSILAAIFRRRV